MFNGNDCTHGRLSCPFLSLSSFFPSLFFLLFCRPLFFSVLGPLVRDSKEVLLTVAEGRERTARYS